jgi:molybdenum cofactor biosynthesis protein B
VKARRPAHRTPRAPRPVVCAIVTVSDTRRGRADTAGALLETLVERSGHRVVSRAWVKDEIPALRRAVRSLLARRDVDAVLVTGGTGPALRDVTPEAVTPLVQRWLPGFGEVFRWKSLAAVGTVAWLSRAAAGIARGRLIVLLPGSPAAVRLAAEEVLLPEIVHIVHQLGRFHDKE